MWLPHDKQHPNKIKRSKQNNGLVRESNPGPPAPKAGIMPLDQQASTNTANYVQCITVAYAVCQCNWRGI